MEQQAWYVAERGVAAGPLTAEEVVARIRAGSLTGQGYVFRSGMDGWALVAGHPDFSVWVTAPPPPAHGFTAPAQTPGGSAHFAVSRNLDGAAVAEPVRRPEPAAHPASVGRAETIPRRFRRGRRGVVRDVQIREVASSTGVSKEYLSFRLERVDERGNVVEQVPVEMKGNIPGRVLRDGDEVVVAGRRRRRHAIRPRAVYVIGTDSVIQPRHWAAMGVAVPLALAGAAFLAADKPIGAALLLGAVVIGALTMWRNR
jgi:hypothetical protein